MAHGIIPNIPETTYQPPKEYLTDDPQWKKSYTLWNQQQAFDEKLHQERQIPYPRDLTGEQKNQLQKIWTWGQAFAILQEIGELVEARENHNVDEETVDVLHFVLSLAEKLDMTPEELGRFEDVFNTAKTVGDQYEDWEEAMHHELPNYILHVSQLMGNTFKWWKNQPAETDLAPIKETLKIIHHHNLIFASKVFANPEQMYNKYMEKVEENHQRQTGTIEGREDYLPQEK